MKKTKISRALMLALSLVMTLSAVSCAWFGQTETTTPEDVTTGEPLPPLEWESYDPALDDSTVDTSAPHTVDATQWTVTDGLDRVVSTNTQTGNIREDKTVAMFYWSWHGEHASTNAAYNNQQNIDKLLAAGKTERDYLTMSTTALQALGVYTQKGPYHFWDEPIYGYYDGDDEWVIRKQAELLAAAGVDVVFFDNTNGKYTWKDTAIRVMKVFSEARAQGVDAPDVAFMLPFNNASNCGTAQLDELFRDIYAAELYKDVWYELDGKPMIMARPAYASTEAMRQFFTFRTGVSSYTAVEEGADQWGWLSTFPQAYFRNGTGDIEQMTVGTAVNHNVKKGIIAPMSTLENVVGRTWTSRGYDTREGALLYGACFAEQWENALYVDPNTVFVTGWNEWIAMRIQYWAPPDAAPTTYQNCFVDQYNAEFSRDIEPSSGVLKDHYYYQLVDYVRRYKGVNPIEKASGHKLIDVGGGFGQWNSVTPVYNDYFGLPDRDADGYLDPATGERLHYTNTTGRNDFYDAKVARDYENVYFMVRTVEDITPYTDTDWMRLYLDMGQSDADWESYEFVLNKQNPDDETTATLERFTGNGFETEVVGKVSYAVKGNVMTVAIPKTMLGIPTGTADFELGFKWTDNTLDNGDIMQWYVNGDTAPVGRFNYCYSTTGSAAYVDDGSKSRGGVIDMTSTSMQEEIDQYMLENVEDASYGFSADGLTLTAEAGDGELVLDFTGNSRQIALEKYNAIRITYKVEDGKTALLRFCIGAGSQPRARSTRAYDVTLTPDGTEHTVTVPFAEIPKHDLTGYVEQLGFFFGKDETAGAKVTVKSVAFIYSDEYVPVDPVE